MEHRGNSHRHKVAAAAHPSRVAGSFYNCSEANHQVFELLKQSHVAVVVENQKLLLRAEVWRVFFKVNVKLKTICFALANDDHIQVLKDVLIHLDQQFRDLSELHRQSIFLNQNLLVYLGI